MSPADNTAYSQHSIPHPDMIKCKDCQKPFPEVGFPYLCPVCGGLFGFDSFPAFKPAKADQYLPGIWRYKSNFGLPDQAQIVSLGEGNTPLIWAEIMEKKIGFKLESQNPTGSFKDRGSAVLVSHLIGKNIKQAVEDSSGNAGASFAAYAARAGIEARIFIPDSAAGPKRQQIETYGADLVPVPGPRSKASDAVLDEVGQGAIYASHAYLPHGTAGIATIAYELLEDHGVVPGAVVLPVGHGSLLLGLALGFQSLMEAGLISRLPKLVAVQAAACAPLFEAFERGSSSLSIASEGKSIAGGVAISNPYHGQKVLEAVRNCGGSVVQVEEEQIAAGQVNLARMGIYVEMTSALVYEGLIKVIDSIPEPVVCIITGHGLKDS